jgi:hypothetical protein
MALEDIFKFEGFGGGVGGVTGIAVAIGTALLAPIVIPFASEVGKPLAKNAIKQGIFLYEKSKEAMAEATEVFEDIVAEAKAELAQEHQDAKAEENQIEVVPITD